MGVKFAESVAREIKRVAGEIRQAHVDAKTELHVELAKRDAEIARLSERLTRTNELLDAVLARAE